MSKFFQRITDSFSGHSGDDDSPGKNRKEAQARRREQVRRAQKSHRERKAEYLKTLESEVTELRATKAAQTWEIRKHRATVVSLKNLLLSHNIAIPPELDNEALETPLAHVEVSNQGSLRTTFPTDSITSGSSPDSNMHANLLLRNPQVGINFILALEHDCLPHFHTTNPDEGSGHIMQFQASLVAHQLESLSAQATQPQFVTGTTWDVSTQELDDQLRRLLVYAQQLSLQGEMTPVMIWSRLQAHPNASSITEAKLDEITQALRRGVVCYGFGAIVDEQFFLETLDRCFGNS